MNNVIHDLDLLLLFLAFVICGAVASAYHQRQMQDEATYKAGTDEYLTMKSAKIVFKRGNYFVFNNKRVHWFPGGKYHGVHRGEASE